MSDLVRRRVSVEVPWRTLLKVLAAIALAWLFLRITDLLLLLVVAVLLAVSLDPVVERVERMGLPRWGAATAVSFALLAAVVLFLWFTWSSLADQTQYLTQHFTTIERDLMHRLPPWARNVVGQNGDTLESLVGPYALRFAKSAGSALVVFVLAFILTLYLLVEARQTRAWLIAFVPPRHRERAERTLSESREVIFGYVVGNVVTSICATIFVFVLLTVLKVPAALLLAVLAGICDFIPVLGFILSAAPALLLAVTVSAGAVLVTLIGYGAYHAVENYLIAPKVYGDRLKLSNVAVVLAFAVGAAVAGVVGAAIALPIAAVYPAIERIWLRETLPEDTVRTHRAIERKAG